MSDDNSTLDELDAISVGRGFQAPPRGAVQETAPYTTDH
jgi:hypothetical protein